MTIRVRAVAIAVSLAVALGACGSNDDETGGGDDASAKQAALSTGAAAQTLSELMQPPKPIELPKLSKTPESGKTVALVSCPVPGCKLAESSTIPAGKLLGWDVKVLDGGLTPEKYAAAMTRALQMGADYIILTALQPNSVISKQLAEAEERHIPVASFASSDPPGGAMKATIFGQNTLRSIGVGLANWVAVDSEGKGKIVLLEDPASPSWKHSDRGFKETLTDVCPGCKLKTREISDLKIGKTIPQETVSYLQTNPDTEYVITAFSGRFLGVPAAIKAAGLSSKVKLGSGTSTPADYELTKADDPPYVLLTPEQTGGYRALDVFARLSVGDPIDKCCTDPKLEEQLLTKQNIGSFDAKLQWMPPDLPQTFAAIWGVDVPPGFKTLSGVGG